MKPILIPIAALLLATSCGTTGRLKYVSVKNAEAPAQKTIKTLQLSEKEIANIQFENDPCDTLYLRGGEIIVAEIQTSGREIVHYKRCNDQKGGEYKVYKKEIASIHYSSGTVLSYDQDGSIVRSKQTEQGLEIAEVSNTTSEESRNRQTTAPEETTLNMGEAKKSLIWGILSYIPLCGAVFSLIAIRYGSRVLRRTAYVGDQEKERKRARTGVFLGGISLFLGICIVLTMIIIAL